MKLLLSVIVAGMLSIGAQANERLVCEKYGRAETPEEFHSIKLYVVKSIFWVSKNKITDQVARTYDRIEPEKVGLEKGTITYYNRSTREVLYLYRNKGKSEVGISHFVEDSDAGFEDKDLFSECQFEERGETPHGVTDASSRVEAGGNKDIKPSWRF